MRKSNEQSLGEIIRDFIRAFNMEDKMNEIKIASSWEKVMGPQINSLTERIVFKNRTLTVFLRSAPLREELFMARTKIVGLINKETGKDLVKDLILK